MATATTAALLAAATAKRAASAPAKPAPAPALSDKPEWDNIDPTKLPADVANLYYAIGKARSAFESAMTALLEPPAHLKLAFAYKRGLAIALVPASRQSDGFAALVAKVTAMEAAS